MKGWRKLLPVLQTRHTCTCLRERYMARVVKTGPRPTRSWSPLPTDCHLPEEQGLWDRCWCLDIRASQRGSLVQRPFARFQDPCTACIAERHGWRHVVHLSMHQYIAILALAHVAMLEERGGRSPGCGAAHIRGSDSSSQRQAHRRRRQLYRALLAHSRWCRGQKHVSSPRTDCSGSQ